MYANTSIFHHICNAAVVYMLLIFPTILSASTLPSYYEEAFSDHHSRSMRNEEQQAQREPIIRLRDHLQFHPRLSPGYDNYGNRRSTAGRTIFRSFWNVPNYCGEKHGVNLPLSNYGIEFNNNNERSFGNVVDVFGHEQLGYYPYVNRTTRRFVNGGLPQLANITAHLEKATEDLLAAIPDPNFDGIGVIDWEQWYPQWDAIYILYRTLSIAHVQARHPEWDAATTAAVAEIEWTQGARLFLESTLKLAMQLRPKAMWGFYHYPYCNFFLLKNSSCPSWQMKMNDALMWMFNETTAMYPSIYLSTHKGVVVNSSRAVNSRLAEAFRLRDKSSNPKGIVFSYTRFNYSSTEYYYNLEDLNATILRSAEFGTHGVVFWGDNYDEKSAQTCRELYDYIIGYLGPTLLMARDGAENCSQRVCSGHGRCVGKILTCEKAVSPWRDHKRWADGSGSEGCSCRCFTGWQGKDCSKTEIN